jgi:hypothetical protein
MEEHKHHVTIQLDGKYGTGSMAEVTIYTNHPNGVKEETYLFPYALIDRKNLDTFNAAHLIAGYRIMKKEKPSPLAELGL